MSRTSDIERRLDDLGDRVRHYADGASDTADSWLSRGRNAIRRVNASNRGQKITRAAEDFADEANYQYRRLRRQVNRHPTATVAIVAGTIGAFFLLRHVFRNDDE
jgi:CHASE3 domain sensor protein